jgi:hypothetical protein
MAASPTPAPGQPARATVKVLCPYCKASFNGRIPQKPARGACPVCQKELILLPNGDIRPSAGFDVTKWQDEPKSAPAPAPEPFPATQPAAAERQSGGGTRLLIKKYAAEPAAAGSAPAAAKGEVGTRILSSKQAEPTPAPAADPLSAEGEPPQLPDWLDDAKGGSRAPAKPARPSTEELLREKEQVRDPGATEAADEGALEAGNNRPPRDILPPVEEPEEPIPPPKPRISVKPAALRTRPQEEEAPPPEPDLLPDPEPPPPPPPTARKAALSRAPAPPPVSVGASESTGGGKVFVAWAMLLIPLLACPVLYNSRDKFKGTPVEKAGAMFRKGFLALAKKLNPPPPPPVVAPPPKVEEKAPEPPPEPPKPDPDQQKKDEQKISHIYNEVLQLERSLKAAGVAASPEQKQSQAQMRDAVEGKKTEIKRLQEMYQKMYGKSYDPANP